MRGLILFCFILCGTQLFAQYPLGANKIVLGRQTTGDGLIFRGSGAPAFTPTSQSNTYFFFDTTEYKLLVYNGSAWTVIADTTSGGGGGGATDLGFSGVSNIITLTSSTGSDVRFVAGPNVTLSSGGDSLVITSSGGSGSQVFENSNTTTTHVLRLSNNGGSLTLEEDYGTLLSSTGADTASVVKISVDTASIATLYALADTASNIRNTGLDGEVKGTLSNTRVDTVDRIVFDPVNGGVDSTYKLVYNSNDYTLHFGIGIGGVSYQMGQELYYPPVINKTASTIYIGQPVMVDTSLLVQGDKLRVVPAINDNLPDKYILGVATHDIAPDAEGLVTWFGYVREVDEAEVADSGVTLDVGDILYISTTPGKYTDVEPDPPSSRATIAIVVRKPSSNNITLLVRPNFIPGIGELRDVDVSAVTNGQTLIYEESTGKWIPGDATGANLRGEGLPNRVTFWQSADTLTFDSLFYFDRANDRLGVGLDDPAFSIDVDSTYGINNMQVIYYSASLQSIYYSDGGVNGTNAFNNTSLGLGSLLSITTGDNSVALGYRALGQVTTGTDNTAIGKDAMYLSTTAGYNTALGYRSLYNNRAGNSNTALGYEALFSSDSTAQNVAIGIYSLYYAKAAQNTGVGSEALGFTVEGGSNTAIGYRSLYRNVGGYQNTAIGKEAGSLWQSGINSGFNQSASNSVYVGFNSRGGAAGSNNEIVIGAGALGNGSTTATLGNDSITKTYLKGQIYLPQYDINDYSGTAEKYLAVDSDGKMIEVDAPTGGGGNVDGTGLANKVTIWQNDSTITYDSNLHWDFVNDRLGVKNSSPTEQVDVNGNVRTSLGRVKVNTSGSQTIHLSNYYTGDSPGYNIWIGTGGNADSGNDVNGYNTAVGYDAMLNKQEGAGNSALGYSALLKNTIGGDNTALGSNSLQENIIGIQNTGAGQNSLFNALDSANTAAGAFGMYNLKKGSYNAAIGYEAGNKVIDNTALDTIRNGIFIGAFTKAKLDNSNNEIVIGYGAEGNGSNTTTLGNDAIEKTYSKGQLYLPQYALNDYGGTPTKYLGIDSTGKVIEIDTAGIAGGTVNIYNSDGTLTGNRTLQTDNYQLKFTGTNEDVNSILEIENLSTKGNLALLAKSNHASVAWFQGSSSGTTTNRSNDLTVFTIERNIRDVTPLTGFGSNVKFTLEASTGIAQNAMILGTRWLNPDNTTRQSEGYISVNKSGSTMVEALNLQGTGQLWLKEYGDTLFTGTPVKILAVEDDGKVIEVDAPSGSGAAGRPAIWNSASTVTYSDNLSWDNTNGYLGIGTSSPIANIHTISSQDYGASIVVGSNTSAANWARMDFKNSNVTHPTILYQDNSGMFTIRTDASYPISFLTNGANERMRIASNGSVGIGVTNPNVRLDISSPSSDALGMRFRARGSDTVSVIQFTDSLASVQTAGITSFGSNLTFSTINSERMRIGSNGNIGIGTNSPSAKLHVNGSLSRNAPVTVTTNYTVADAVSWLICNGTGTITLTLPTAASWTGRELMVKTIANQSVVSIASNVVPLAGGAAGTAILTNTAGKWATLVSDGSNWIIMQAN